MDKKPEGDIFWVEEYKQLLCGREIRVTWWIKKMKDWFDEKIDRSYFRIEVV